jgi:hypothetical protein
MIRADASPIHHPKTGSEDGIKKQEAVNKPTPESRIATHNIITFFINKILTEYRYSIYICFNAGR